MPEQRSEAVEGVRRLVQWASSVAFGEVPSAVARRAAMMTADNLAAIVAARDHHEVRAVQERLAAGAPTREATVFAGRGWKTDRYSAAVANVVAGSWTELDEGYSVASCHAGLYTLPPVLAEAEAEGRSVAEVLGALVVGYEVVSRIARSWTFRRFTVHTHASYSGIGAVAATAALRRYDGRAFLDAVTAAATLAGAGSYSHALHGGLVRNVWAGHGVWNGMRLADWALAGIGGLAEGLYEVFTEAMSVEPKTAELTSGLGRDWAILDGFQKIHACCQSAHTAVDATLALLGDLPETDRTAGIARIVVDTPRLEMGNTAPENTLAAKFSIPQIVAASLVYGHAGVGAFADESLAHPEIVRLRNAVELRPLALDQAANTRARPARVTIDLADGRTLAEERTEPVGNPKNPLSPETLRAKIVSLTEAAYPRMADVALDLMALGEGRLQQSWTDVVAEMCVGEPG